MQQPWKVLLAGILQALVLVGLGAWIVYRIARLVVFAFRHDARRFAQ